jgi:ABC-2 type transport system permease protein
MGVLGIILLVTGNRLSFPPALFLPLGVMLGGVYGLGFVLGSLSLMYKRVEALLGMSQFLLMALVVVPFETWETPVARFLPLVPGAILMRDLMARSLPLDWTGLAVAAVNSAVYFILGLTVFHWMEKQTKRKGLLGSY